MIDRPFGELLRRLTVLEALHGLYQQAEGELTRHIGVPICMDKCGKCCQHNTVMVWGIEVERIASCLVGQRNVLNEVMERCERWLLHDNGVVPSPTQLAKNPLKVIQAGNELVKKLCPLLQDDMKCLIHVCRPLACRAYGVTTYPVDCPRPPGFGEDPSRKAYNRGMGERVKVAFHELMKDFGENDRQSATVGFLPTLLMAKLRADRFAGLVDSGMVHPVKLSRGFMASPTILWESQKADMTLAGQESLDEVVKKGIPSFDKIEVFVGRR